MGNREAIPPSTRFEVLRHCNFACYYCGVPAAMGLKQLHVEHVTPVALGGTNALWNLVAACWDCNAGKAATAPPSWLVEQVMREWAEDTCSRVRKCTHCERMWEPDLGDAEPNDECWPCVGAWVNGYYYLKEQSV